jgi:transcription-repair coupling factor (superfamily II helicase)
MLKVQAERETAEGHPFPPDSHWQQEFERSFHFTETPDQLKAIRDAKTDMESTRAMDRLICGDVGFGKTEVAIRAAFKAVTSGKQAAIIAPTTVLAQQHWQNFRERMSEYPVTIELLSRYRSAAEQKKVIKALGEGSVDIIVGTHRVISQDVIFKDLGLVVVDEEQRFGVKHKDALKEKFRLVDVLTLSATPIPRTLYLSLMGARDMSVIETPPPNRQPVETIVCGYDERVIRDAIKRELARGGQIYFLHNRVQTIERVAARIRELCEGARVIVGHGQMEEKELEGVMQNFVAGKADILVSTTIIESGLDIPNANTIIIDRADRFGLADLYQLRGRVGRSGTKAYAYLLLPRELMSVGSARKRVSAIKQY